LKQRPYKPRKILGFASYSFTLVIADESFSSDATCSPGEECVNEEFFQKIAGNEMPDPKSRKI
jgi:hypothetical protein